MDERVDHTTTGPDGAPLSRETRVRSRSRWSGLVVGLVIILLAGWAGWHWWSKPAPAPAGRAGNGRAGQGPPQLVGAASADTGDIRVVLNELGTVTPLATVTVKTQINGQFTEIGFQEGQMVKKGDFLAQIDPRPYQVALQLASGQLAHDEGLLQQAQADLKRYQTLGHQDSISQQQVEDQKFLVDQYTGTVKADEANVNSANLNLTYCHIVAPVTGQVGLRQVDPGNYVQTSDANGIVVLTQMQPISVIFSVPEDNLPDIISRLRAGATLTVAAYDRANVRHLADGEVSTLDNQIDTTTGTLKVRANFANPDELLYPNQFVNAHLLVNTLHNVVRVPVAAVQRGEPGTYVYVIDANDTVSVRPVKLGTTDETLVQVISGLKAGEKVVTDGTDRLRDGAPVKIAPPKPPAAGQPATGQGTATQPATGEPAAGQPAAGQPANGQPGAPAQPASGQAGGGQGSGGHGHHGQPPAGQAPADQPAAGPAPANQPAAAPAASPPAR